MASILEGELAEILSDALAQWGIPYPMTVTRGEETGPEYEPTVIYTNYDCQGWRDQYGQEDIDGTAIQTRDVRLLVLINSITIVPNSADKITANGETYGIVSVTIDPAGTVYDIQGRT